MSHKALSLVVGLGLSFFASSAFAQESSVADPPPSRAANGVEVGVRTGIPYGFGDMMKGVDSSASGAVPLWVDLGYRFSKIYVGAYGEYVYVIPKSGSAACPNGANCSAYSLSAGLNAHYHFRPGYTADPWVGLGVGYESASLSSQAGPMNFTGNFRGFNAGIQGGCDFRLSRSFALGPVLSASLGEYTRNSAKMNDQEASGPIPGDQQRFHVTTLLGIRGTFNVFATR